jgi:hypothetical protein
MTWTISQFLTSIPDLLRFKRVAFLSLNMYERKFTKKKKTSMEYNFWQLSNGY